MSDLESLMRDVARAVQGDARRRQLLPEIQARLAALEEQSRQSQRAHGTWRLSLLGAAACAAGIAFFVTRPHPLSYVVDGAGAGRTAAVGEHLVASDSGPLALRFSDGSQVTLPPRAEAHVDALDAQGATVALEEGTVEVSVVHRAQTRWEIRAGRYHIRVTGTRFSAGWDRRAQALTVTMREGSVEVTGPGLKAPAHVVTGQRLRAGGAAADNAGEEPEVVVEDTTTTAAREAVAPAPAAEPEAAAPSEAPAPVVEAQPEPAPAKPIASAPARDDRRGGSRARRAAPTLVARADSEWRALEGRGRFKDALDAAVREGFETNCARLGADDVTRLGEIARLAGDFKRAEYAYQAARRRFASPPAAALFGLGKIALDQHHDPVAAAKWFHGYVERGGPLAREAAGLLLVSRIKAGDNAGARDAAASYLSSFPDGPHAKLARDTVRH
jgi:hypothetical protein